MKIWAKLYVGDKLKKNVIYEDDKALSGASYIHALQEVSHMLDIASPVSLPAHFKHFERFNRAKYLPRDFVEEVDFDSFVLERVIEDKKPNRYFF